MAVLYLSRLKCNSTTRGWGDDDAYIEIDGESFWGGDTTEIGDEETLDIDMKWTFMTRAKVVLFDWDEGDNDTIGTISVDLTTPRNEELVAKMNGDGSDYELYYSVQDA